jgi:hypothetical protein
MIKRDITETVYEYDKEGKLVRKTVTETHEEEDNTITTYPSWSYLNGAPVVCCGDTISTTTTKYNCTNSTTSKEVAGTYTKDTI